MAAQQSAQQASQSHPPKKRLRWLYIIIIVACTLALLSFIGATIFWIGLVHDKLPDTLGAIFTALGTIFGFIALIPLFFQYLQERRSVPSPISSLANTNNNDQSPSPAQQPTPNLGNLDISKVQSYSTNEVRPSLNSQQPPPLNQTVSSMNRLALNAPTQLRTLSPREKEQFVDKLLACPTMKERSSRNRVVQELRFADSMSRNPDATNKDDVMDIVNRCLNFSDGLQQLVERIQYREDNSLPMQELNAFVQSLS
jgi:hypothetical protein